MRIVVLQRKECRTQNGRACGVLIFVFSLLGAFVATQYIRPEVIRNKRFGLYRNARRLVFSIGIGYEHTPQKTKFISGMRLLWNDRE